MASHDLDIDDLGVSDDEVQFKGCEDDDAGSVSDSPSLGCVGCKISSKHPCPIEARKSELRNGEAAPGNKEDGVRVSWGNHTRRKKKTRSGRKVKIRQRCGAWCRICRNLLKKTIKKKKYVEVATRGAKKGDKHAAVKKVKEELENGSLGPRWMRAYKEAVHVYAGGKSRIYSKGASVADYKEEKHELSQPGKFYELKKYKEMFGEPSITKAKVVKRVWKGKSLRGVVVVSETDAGVLDHMTKSSAGVRRKRTKFNGEDALVEEDLDEAESDALEEMSQEFPHSGGRGGMRGVQMQMVQIDRVQSLPNRLQKPNGHQKLFLESFCSSGAILPCPIRLRVHPDFS